jgi:hypothetical protein
VKAVIMAALFLEGISHTRMGIEVIDVCHKYVLHGFAGADEERAQEVDVHCACVEVGKGGKTKHVMGDADFFGWLETVDVALGLDDGRLHGECGLNALAVVLHVTLVGSC